MPLSPPGSTVEAGWGLQSCPCAVLTRSGDSGNLQSADLIPVASKGPSLMMEPHKHTELDPAELLWFSSPCYMGMAQASMLFWTHVRFPWWLSGKELLLNRRNQFQSLGGEGPGKVKWHSILLGNPMDRELAGCSQGHKSVDMTQLLSNNNKPKFTSMGPSRRNIDGTCIWNIEIGLEWTLDCVS